MVYTWYTAGNSLSYYGSCIREYIIKLGNMLYYRFIFELKCYPAISRKCIFYLFIYFTLLFLVFYFFVASVNLSLHWLLCLLHYNVVPLCPGFVNTKLVSL